MLNALDLLIVVVMGLAAAGLLATVLMFVLRNPKVKRICMWMVAALGVYMAYVGFRINWPGFLPQVALAVTMGLTAVGSVVLERLAKGDKEKQRIAHILATVALTVGMFNAFM